MKRRVFLLAFVAVLVSLAPQQTPATFDNTGNLEARPSRGPGSGRVVVEVLEISDLTPVEGVRVELVENGRILRTDSSGRVVFRLQPGGHDLRVHDLTGPGPAIRIDEVHADITAGQTTVIQIFDCGSCL